MHTCRKVLWLPLVLQVLRCQSCCCQVVLLRLLCCVQDTWQQLLQLCSKVAPSRSGQQVPCCAVTSANELLHHV
jgi:hypothetical protein